ncbi:hypothetical protein BN59_01749 [Legionella massiliensis]|uniref:Uncharacterized protein n=1 Tax=Legionella massiliensis TaxID=1034943 RepID=A0A078KWY5_9GAMM|nr:hypothetical protein [Legionella massiliensis]CDZ77466.1 hypothetical protein BN59_01749 [Legionella massiliensis]CEE13204.1 hypothetical protein BN1094_01749 [Legionella massiliensis]
MGEQIEKIIYPKRKGLTKKSKPQVIILGSPHDSSGDSAVKYSGTKTFVDNLGYNVLNKEPLLFGESEISLKKIRPITTKSREVTVWLEAHGAPGWVFGSQDSKISELNYTLNFASYIAALERGLGVKVNNIVLNCCNSATEACNWELDQPSYFISPARILSIMLPGINVMGFVGTNSSAVITNLFQVGEEGYAPAFLGLHDGAVLFNSGKVLETGKAFKNLLLCDHKTACTPKFVLDGCGFDRDELLQVALAQEVIDQVRAEGSSSSYDSLGDWQNQQASAFAMNLKTIFHEAGQDRRATTGDDLKSENRKRTRDHKSISLSSQSMFSRDMARSLAASSQVSPPELEMYPSFVSEPEIKAEQLEISSDESTRKQLAISALAVSGVTVSKSIERTASSNSLEKAVKHGLSIFGPKPFPTNNGDQDSLLILPIGRF